MKKQSKFGKKLAAISSIGVVGTVGAEAFAAVNHVDPTDIVLSLPTVMAPPGTPNDYDWNIDGDGDVEFQFEANLTNTAATSNFQINVSPIGPGAEFVLSTGGNVANLANLGTVLKSGLPTGYTWGASAGQTLASGFRNSISSDDDLFGFTSGDDGYIGFRFTDGADLHYGWARITKTLVEINPPMNVVDDFGFGVTATLTIHEWAYEDDPGLLGIYLGDSVTSVPEPSSLALAALGVAGVTSWRKRRKTAI